MHFGARTVHSQHRVNPANQSQRTLLEIIIWHYMPQWMYVYIYIYIMYIRMQVIRTLAKEHEDARTVKFRGFVAGPKG